MQLRVLVLGVDLVVDADGQRHLRVGAAVAEDDPAVAAPVRLRLQHPLLERLGLARVDAGAHRGGPDVVLVAAVLPVEGLGGDHHRRVVVQHGDLEGHDRQVPLGEGHHPGRLTPCTRLPAGRAPDDVAAQHAVAEVERPLVDLEVGDRQQHRLVVDVELDRLVVGDVDDGLPDPGEAERLLGVPDRPDLVEAVDEGAVGVGLAALLDVAAHARGSRCRPRTASR